VAIALDNHRVDSSFSIACLTPSQVLSSISATVRNHVSELHGASFLSNQVFGQVSSHSHIFLMLVIY